MMSSANLGLIFLGFLIFISLLGAIAAWVTFSRSGASRSVAENVEPANHICPICEGYMYPAELLGTRTILRVRQNGKTYPVGVLRCEECGYIALFS